MHGKIFVTLSLLLLVTLVQAEIVEIQINYMGEEVVEVEVVDPTLGNECESDLECESQCCFESVCSLTTNCTVRNQEVISDVIDLVHNFTSDFTYDFKALQKLELKINSFSNALGKKKGHHAEKREDAKKRGKKFLEAASAADLLAEAAAMEAEEAAMEALVLETIANSTGKS